MRSQRLPAALLLLTLACSGRDVIVVEIHGRPEKGFLPLGAECMGVPVDWSVHESSGEPDVGYVEVPKHTFPQREEQVLTCLRSQPGVTDVRVRR